MSLASLIATGTNVWLDGVHPRDVEAARTEGITGATSNPTIVASIIESGILDQRIDDLIEQGNTDDQIAWQLDDELVSSSQDVFMPAWKRSAGNDGYVSFELDPMIEHAGVALSHPQRVKAYYELGIKWSAGRPNRMIKVPATAAGFNVMEALAAAGIKINVTLMFTNAQYQRARDAIWRGAQRNPNGTCDFKSVYSIFVSRVDAYTARHVPDLSPAAQGMVGIVNAKRVWRENEVFWQDKGLRLQQEIVFASTGVKNPAELPDKYVRALAGGGIQTNSLATIQAVKQSRNVYTRQVDQLPAQEILDEIDRKVDLEAMEQVLIQEGIAKFVQPQFALLRYIAQRRASQCEQLATAKEGLHDPTQTRV